MLFCFCILTSVLILIFQMNTHDTYSRMHNREYLSETDIQKNFKTQHRTKNINLSSTCTKSHANRNSTKMTIKNIKQTF